MANMCDSKEVKPNAINCTRCTKNTLVIDIPKELKKEDTILTSSVQKYKLSGNNNKSSIPVNTRLWSEVDKPNDVPSDVLIQENYNDVSIIVFRILNTIDKWSMKIFIERCHLFLLSNKDKLKNALDIEPYLKYVNRSEFVHLEKDDVIKQMTLEEKDELMALIQEDQTLGE